MRVYLTVLAATLLVSISCAKTKLSGGTPTVTTPVKKSDNVKPETVEDDEKDEPETVEDEVTEPELPPVEVPEPGVPVTKVGINFEDAYDDRSNGNKDYNDAVLCFEGAFSVVEKEGKIVSAKTQEFKPFTYRGGACNTSLRIVIERAGKIISDHKEFPEYKVYSNQKSQSLKFEKGDVLKVELIPDPNPCADGKTRTLFDDKYVQVGLNTCHNTGN
ncbi:MAG: hypothetical protein EOP04_03440 [Proteobacteria bacterium]|nr:MAG: hypothetical protein EOP04_03440 [Pseudomonadota bacterium]